MTAAPTLAEQVAAVAWVLDHVKAMDEADPKLASEINEMRLPLEAARETLKTLEFMQDTLR